jgi:hypothetical protein
VSAKLPRWIVIWFAISVPLVLWDVAFVLLRPASMAGGSLSFLWAPYAKYVTIDRSYGDLGNGFVRAQAIMSLVEIALLLAAPLLAARGRRAASTLIVFAVSLLTCAKTILILMIVVVTGGADLGGSASDVVLLYLAPNGAWIVVPALVAWKTGRRLLDAAVSDRIVPDTARPSTTATRNVSTVA